MDNFRVVFEFLKGVTQKNMRKGKVRPGFKYVKTHILFILKMDSKFTRKARLLAGGHNTSTPLSITYSSVVTREMLDWNFQLLV